MVSFPRQFRIASLVTPSVFGMASLCGLPVAAAALCERPVLGAGIVHIAPRTSSGPLIESESGGQPVNLPFPGSGVKARDADTLLLIAECETTANLKFRFAFGIPPRHEFEATGSTSGYGVFGSVRQWSPTLLAIYTFLPPTETWRPFIGGGFNYTFFRSAHFSNEAFRRTVLGPDATTSVGLKSSWNPTATAGLALRLQDSWTVEAAASYIPLRTRATVTANNTNSGGPVMIYSDAKNRAVAVSVTLNYHLAP